MMTMDEAWATYSDQEHEMMRCLNWWLATRTGSRQWCGDLAPEQEVLALRMLQNLPKRQRDMAIGLLLVPNPDDPDDDPYRLRHIPNFAGLNRMRKLRRALIQMLVDVGKPIEVSWTPEQIAKPALDARGARRQG